MPRSRACAGEVIVTALPASVIEPAVAGVTPKIVCASSVRPEPTSPAMPRISPACSVNEMSCTRDRYDTPFTSSNAAPIATSLFG